MFRNIRAAFSVAVLAGEARVAERPDEASAALSVRVGGPTKLVSV